MASSIKNTNQLIVKQSEGKGRGVFAGNLIKKGDIIEQCPVILLEHRERKDLDRTTLYDYYFAWNDTYCCFALGYGGLYNHSFQPNANYKRNLESLTIDFIALTAIDENEEITVNYNGKPEDQTELWKTKQGQEWVP